MGYFSRLLRSLRPDARDRDHRDEVASHIEERAEALIQQGLAPDAARAEARSHFGREIRVRERMREADGLPWVDRLGSDVEHLWRSLRRDALSTVAITGSLAVGVGVTVGLFFLAHSLLYRPLPVPAPDELVALRSVEGENPVPLLAPMVQRIRDERIFDAVCGLLTLSATVQIDERMSPVAVHPMTGDCFAPMGVGAAVGRLLTDDDGQEGRPHVALLTWEAWHREFAGRPDVLQQTVNVDGTRYQIVGVTARGFTGYAVGQPAQLFIPFGNFADGLRAYFPPPDLQVMEVIARRRSGDAFAAVAARVVDRWSAWLDGTVSPRLQDGAKRQYLQRRVSVMPGSTGLPVAFRDRLGRPAVALLMVAVVMLGMGCLNAANLLLARSAGRRREAAVRAAMGASTRQLVREAIVENLPILLGVLAGASVVAITLVQVLTERYQQSSPAFGLSSELDQPVVVFAVSVTLLAWVLVLALPAWRTSRVEVGSDLTSPRVVGGSQRTRYALVAAQVGLTVVLLVVGTFFATQLRSLYQREPGFITDRLWVAQLSARPGGYDGAFDSGAHYRDLVERVTMGGQVASAALIRTPPFQAQSWVVPVGQAGRAEDVPLSQAFVTDGFFETLRLPVVAGHDFARIDQPRNRHVAILSQDAARMVFGDAPAVGRFIRVGSAPVNQQVEVIGVVADAILGLPQQGTTPVVYLSFWQYGAAVQTYPSLVVRGLDSRPPDRQAVHAAVDASGREYVSVWRAMDNRRDAALVNEYLLASLSGVFGVLALLLATLGLYGLLRLLVVERAAEFGVRVALGATAGRIARMVAGQTVLIVGAGAVAGVVTAGLLNAGLSTVLGTPVSMSAAHVGVAMVLMMAAALAASAGPVRRASSVNPLEQIRRE